MQLFESAYAVDKPAGFSDNTTAERAADIDAGIAAGVMAGSGTGENESRNHE